MGINANLLEDPRGIRGVLRRQVHQPDIVVFRLLLDDDHHMIGGHSWSECDNPELLAAVCWLYYGERLQMGCGAIFFGEKLVPERVGCAHQAHVVRAMGGQDEVASLFTLHLDVCVPAKDVIVREHVHGLDTARMSTLKAVPALVRAFDPTTIRANIVAWPYKAPFLDVAHLLCMGLNM